MLFLKVDDNYFVNYRVHDVLLSIFDYLVIPIVTL